MARNATSLPTQAPVSTRGSTMNIAKILLLGVLLSFSALPVSAAEDSAALQALFEKEWAFRTREFPGLGQRGVSVE